MTVIKYYRQAADQACGAYAKCLEIDDDGLALDIARHEYTDGKWAAVTCLREGQCTAHYSRSGVE